MSKTFLTQLNDLIRKKVTNGILSNRKSNILRRIRQKWKKINEDEAFLRKFSKEYLSKKRISSLITTNKKQMFLPEGTWFCDVLSSGAKFFVIQQEPQVRTINFTESFFGQEYLNIKYDPHLDSKFKRSYPDIKNATSVRLAFPYVVFLISVYDEKVVFRFFAYYTNKPLSSLEDRLYCVNLPNCYGGDICLGSVNFSSGNLPSHEKAAKLINHFWASYFATSSFRYYTEIAKTDKRFATIWEWEKNTKKDPGFVLNVKWQQASPSCSARAIRDSFDKYSVYKGSSHQGVQENLNNFGCHEYPIHLKQLASRICSSTNSRAISIPRSLSRNIVQCILKERVRLENLKIKKEKEKLRKQREAEKKAAEARKKRIAREQKKMKKGVKVRLRKDSSLYSKAPKVVGIITTGFGAATRYGKPAAKVSFSKGKKVFSCCKNDLTLAKRPAMKKGSRVKPKDNTSHYYYNGTNPSPRGVGVLIRSNLFNAYYAVKFSNGLIHYYRKRDLEVLDN